MNVNFYRPQTTFAKVMFLHLSVILFRGGVSQHVMGQTPPSPRKTPGRHPQEDRPAPGRHPEDPTPGRQTPQGRHQEDPPQEDRPRGSRHPPADGYCCGRYASYWNAFLLHTLISVLNKNQVEDLCEIPLDKSLSFKSGILSDEVRC